MTDEIAPALTAEEWKWWLDGEPPITELDSSFIGDYAQTHGGADSRHACAAVCLYGQPFGFTREDVALLRQVAETQEFYGGTYNSDVFDPEDKARLHAIADRIEALLPPQ